MKGKLKSIHSMLMIFEMIPVSKKKIIACFSTLFSLGSVFAEAHVVPGVQFRFHDIHHDTHVAKEGLVMWLSAKDGLVKSQ